VSFVVDNSVALAWCFEAEHTAALVALLRRVDEGGVVAPLLWPIEAANGLLVAERRGRVTAERRGVLIGFLTALPIALDPETTDYVWDTTSRMAAQHRLTVYDATYLELALRRALPLATLDHDLRRAAETVGLELLGQ
jgi:predicted nucleic acid-binding protein